MLRERQRGEDVAALIIFVWVMYRVLGVAIRVRRKSDGCCFPEPCSFDVSLESKTFFGGVIDTSKRPTIGDVHLGFAFSHERIKGSLVYS